MNYKILILVALLLTTTPYLAEATVKLNGVSTDPAIIASGDEVDVVVNFENKDFDMDAEEKGAQLTVLLKPADSATQEYVTIFDNSGDGSIGHLFIGENWRSIFRVKIAENAPPGTYEFVLEFSTKNAEGEAIGGIEKKYFKLNVKKEGINIAISNLQTVPGEVRSGDNYVKLDLYVENIGEKDAKSVGVKLDLPEGLSHSYSNANDIRIGRLNAGEQKTMTFYVNVDENAQANIYSINADVEYFDLDNNDYGSVIPFNLLVKEKPNIEVVNFSGEGVAGATGKLIVTLKNTGSERAEAVDVRLIKQNSQPFEFDVRSNYVGQLEPGEEGQAIFKIDVSRDAEFKEHDFKLFIRAKGDSDNGNNNIYTFSDRAKFTVEGTAPNYTLYIGAGLVAIVVLLILIKTIFWRKRK